VDAANPAAVKKAYKKAALRFHPDRTRGYTLEQRLNGEEVWKLLAQKMEEFNRRGL
jgi:DnaJ-class molecular chaperone